MYIFVKNYYKQKCILMDKLNTKNPNNYHYTTKDLEIHILGGLQINKMESLRVTLSIENLNPNQSVLHILRQSIDLYNDNTVEKFIRKCAERLEIGTNLTRRTLQELTKALENYRFLILDTQNQDRRVKTKKLTKAEKDQAIKFLKSKNLLEKTNELIGKSGVIPI